jgi:hypothetical protein
MHHIDVHVTDLAATRPLLEAVFPLVRYELRSEDDGFVSYWRGGVRPSIGFIEDDESGGTTRLAFAVDSRERVDGAAQAASSNGARYVEGPGLHPEYGDDYYAVFFEDAHGNRYEIVYDEEGA